MLKIAVCIKQVPALSEGEMDHETGVILRQGDAISNVYDLSAIEFALQIKESGLDVTIEAFTMGPASAASVLADAYAMGVDNSYHLVDRAFAGADVLATSYTLFQAISSVGDYQIILCGKQTTDGDTGQVGGAIAQWMDIPHITNVVELCNSKEHLLSVRQQLDEISQQVQIFYPCLLSVERHAFPPRLPTLKSKLLARKQPIHTLTVSDLPDNNPDHYGHKGSATKVEAIFPPKPVKKQDPLHISGSEQLDALANLLLELATGGESL